MQRQHVAMHLQQVLLKCLHRLLPNRLKKKPPSSSPSSGGFFLRCNRVGVLGELSSRQSLQRSIALHAHVLR